MSFEFSKDACPPESSEVGHDSSPHEILRKAVACCDGDDKIVLSLATAMALVMEWDKT